jgi:hypothetical protein
MADNKSTRGPADSARINVNEDYEVQYWTETLGISKEQLVDVVRRVGPLAKDVRAELDKH